MTVIARFIVLSVFTILVNHGVAQAAPGDLLTYHPCPSPIECQPKCLPTRDCSIPVISQDCNACLIKIFGVCIGLGNDPSCELKKTYQKTINTAQMAQCEAIKAEEKQACESTKTACDFTNRLADECKQSSGARMSGSHEDPATTLRAVVAYRTMLQSLTRESTPLDWAITQNNLGIALEQRGEQRDSPLNLEEAVSAYRDALQESTRERAPVQ